jgi:hypothetical protein
MLRGVDVPLRNAIIHKFGKSIFLVIEELFKTF